MLEPWQVALAISCVEAADAESARRVAGSGVVFPVADVRV